MFFGMFGSIFLLAQFFQTVQGYSPLQSGLRILPWTAMPIFIAPIAGALSDRIGGQRLMAAGLALQAAGLLWIAAVTGPTTPYVRPRRAVRALGARDGALLRAGRERRPLAPCGPSRRARRRARRTRSASSAASSASRCSPRSSRASAATAPARPSCTARATAVYVGGALVAVGAVAAALIKAAAAQAVGVPDVVLEAAQRAFSRGSVRTVRGFSLRKRRSAGRRPCGGARPLGVGDVEAHPQVVGRERAAEPGADERRLLRGSDVRKANSSRADARHLAGCRAVAQPLRDAASAALPASCPCAS